MDSRMQIVQDMNRNIAFHIHRFIYVVFLCLLVITPDIRPAMAASAKSTFYAAERCYLELSNSATKQKYRDRWLRCIEKFKDVYQLDPKGPWAAAGLYKAGMLYSELYKISYKSGDKQEAVELFSRLIESFPKSRYTPKAAEAKAVLIGNSNDVQTTETDEPGESDPPSSGSTKAYERYKQAQTYYHSLQQKTALHKYRDQWFKCIENYRKAYQEEPQGPLAAAALFGMARCYEQLYQNSSLNVDQIQSQNTYKELIRLFPGSPYAEKALVALGDESDETQSGTSGGDAITQVILESREPAATAPEPMTDVSSQSPSIIEGLRYWSNPRYTRVVLDANQDTVFTYHELREDPSVSKPQRIYIDVHNSRLSRNLQKVVPINDNLLSDARAGQYTPDIVRVVIDIKSFNTYKIFSLKNPFRIVLDVWGAETESAVSVKPPVVDTNNRKLPTSALVKSLALGVRRIVIDPGHGGKDYGAPGYIKGVHEKHVVLQIAKRLAKMIPDELNCEAVMTRSTDTYLSLEERTAIANTQSADLFISIHTNASHDKRAYGLETFILNLATDDEAIRVAARENATSTKNISDLDSILQDLMQNAKVNESSRLAGYVQNYVLDRLKTHKYSQIRSKGVKQAPFYVLLGADMPSILVETAFISNPQECKRLISADYQEQLCKGIIAGIKRYIDDTRAMADVPGLASGGRNGS